LGVGWGETSKMGPGGRRAATKQISRSRGTSIHADPVQAQNVTWQNYHVENVTFPIYVTQTYVK
jgi:hypothetical protein